jgi:hypothetical protein
MDITVDLTEVEGLSVAMDMAPNVLDSELAAASDVILGEGIGYAKEEAPVDNSDLKNSIRMLDGPNSDGGSYGTDLIYAWQREEGGEIVPRNKTFLAFRLPEAVTAANPEGWVYAKKVTQEGSHYMQKSMETLEPRVLPIFGAAVDRTLEQI